MLFKNVKSKVVLKFLAYSNCNGIRIEAEVSSLGLFYTYFAESTLCLTTKGWVHNRTYFRNSNLYWKDTWINDKDIAEIKKKGKQFMDSCEDEVREVIEKYNTYARIIGKRELRLVVKSKV